MYSISKLVWNAQSDTTYKILPYIKLFVTYIEELGRDSWLPSRTIRNSCEVISQPIYSSGRVIPVDILYNIMF